MLEAWFGVAPTLSQAGRGVLALFGCGAAASGAPGLAGLRAGDEREALALWAVAATLAGLPAVAWLSLGALGIGV